MAWKQLVYNGGDATLGTLQVNSIENVATITGSVGNGLSINGGQLVDIDADRLDININSGETVLSADTGLTYFVTQVNALNIGSDDAAPVWLYSGNGSSTDIIMSGSTGTMSIRAATTSSFSSPHHKVSASTILSTGSINRIIANNIRLETPNTASIIGQTWTANDVLSTGKWSYNYKSFGLVVDGGGAVITTGVKSDVSIPFNMKITGWYLTADQAGSIVIDVWKDVFANFPPTILDTIAGAELPSLVAAQSNSDTNLTTWTTTVAAGDVIRFNVNSATTITKISLTIFGYQIP